MMRFSPKRFTSALTLSALIIMQFATGVFPVPIAPTQSAAAAKHFELTKSANKSTVSPGDTITYTITATNPIGNPVANHRIIDPVPTGLTFESGSAGCGYVSISDEVICPAPPPDNNGEILNPGESNTVTLTFRVDDNLKACTEIINQADVWDEDANRVLPQWSNVVTVTVDCPNPILEATKTVNKTTVNPGDRIEYEIEVENVGTSDAENVVVTDTIPDGLIFDSRRSSNECDQQGYQIVCDIGTIRDGRDETVDIAFTVDSDIFPPDPLCDSDIVNSATVTATSVTAVVTNSVDTYLECLSPTLVVKKTANKSTVSPGDRIEYEVEVENTGNGDAFDVVVSDNIPTGLTFDAARSDRSCDQQGNLILCDAVDIDAGRTERFDIAFTVNDYALCNGTIVNQADAISTNGGSGWDSETITVTCPDPDLSIQKTVNYSTVSPDDTLIYTIEIENDGQGIAEDVIVSDNIPTGLTYVTSSNNTLCSVVNSVIVCGPFDMDPGEDTTFTFTFTVNDDAPCNGTIVNQADVIADNHAALWDSTDVDVTCPQAELQATKSADVSDVTIGDRIIYTITVSNVGAATATDVEVIDVIPDGLSYVDSASDFRCDRTGNQVECGPVDIDAGDDLSFTIAFDVIDGAPCGEVIPNLADVLATNAPTVWSNQVDVDVTCVGALAVTKSVNVNAASQGESLLYDIDITNNGQMTLTDVWILDTIPDHLTFDAGNSDTSCFQQGNMVKCGPPDIDINQSDTIRIAFTIDANATCDATISNFVDALAENVALVRSNTVQTVVTCLSPVLMATKEVDSTDAQPGDTITYTILAKNIGTATATDVEIIDQIPVGLTYVPASSSSSCRQVGSDIRCTPFDLDAGTMQSVTLVFTVNNLAACDATIANIADVSADNADTVWSNEVSTDITCPPVILTGTKSVDTVFADIGDRVTYTIDIENTSTVDALNVLLSDTIPDGLTFVPGSSDSTCSEASGEITCTAFDLSAGTTQSFTLAFDVAISAVCASSINNSAEFTADTLSTLSTNTVSTFVSCADAALQATKEVDRDTADIGDTLTYDFEITNTGQATAADVILSDTIPDGLTFVSASDSSCTVSNDILLCGPFTIGAQETQSLSASFTIDIDATCDQSIINNATITSSSADTVTTNSVATLTLCPNVNVKVKKTANRSTVGLGEVVIYTIDVMNLGIQNAHNVTVIDDITQGLTFVSNQSSSTCSASTSTVVCGPTTIDPGATESFDIALQVDSITLCDETIFNQAEAQGDNVSSTLSDSVDVDVECDLQDDADLRITKTGPTQIQRGSTIVYTINVENIGPDDAEDVVVTDAVPTSLIFNASLSDGDCYLSGNDVICDGFDLDDGRDIDLDIAFDVPTNAHCAKTILNEVEVESDTNDPVLSNNVATHTSTVTCDATTFDIDKTDYRSTAKPGDFLTYEISVSNTSTTDADDVEIVDTLPCDVTFDSADRGGTYDANASGTCNGDVTWTIDIDAGDTEVVEVTVEVDDGANGTVLTNEAEIPSTGQRATDTTTVDTVELGCIEIIKEAFDPDDDLITPVPQFTFRLDGADPKHNGSDGTVIYQDVETGVHTITEDIPATWQLLSITPPGGVVTVNPGSNCAVAVFKNKQVLDEPTFSISKTDNATSVAPGGTLTYEIDIENTSDVDATNLQIVDTLPSFVTFQSASNGGTFSNGKVTWEVDLLQNASRTLTVTVTVDSDAPDQFVLFNTAAITSGPSADDTTTVFVDREFGCVEVIKEAFDPDNNLITPVPQFTFRLDGANDEQNDGDGKIRYDNVAVGAHTVSEVLPSGWELLSTTPPNGNVVVSEGDNCAVAIFKNRQVLDGDTAFSITKTDGQTSADPGDTLTYTITVTNTSTTDATAVEVTDTIPTNTTFVSASDSASLSGDLVTWTFDLDAGQSKTLTLTVTVSSSLTTTTTIVNTALVTNGPSATDTTTINVDDEATFSITKTDGRSSADAGDTLTYTITVTNTSSVDATDVQVIDTVPGDTSFVSSSGNSTRSGDVVTYTFDLDAGQSTTLTLSVQIDDDADDTTIVNTAQVVGGPSATDSTDVDEEDDDDDDDDVRISITDDPDPVDVCDDNDLEYEIRLSNSSNSNKTVDVIALLDGDTEYQSSSDGGDEEGGDRVRWDNVKVNRNGTRTLRLRVHVENGNRDGDTLRLSVAVSDGDEDTEVTRVRSTCDDDDDGFILETPDLTIDKSGPTEATAGSLVSYTVTIRNTSNADITNATLDDQYPSTQLTIDDPGGATENGSTLHWELGTLRANSTTVVRYRARVRQSLPEGTRIQNTATVRGEGITRSDTHTIVIPQPPQTGLGGFIRSIAQNGENLSEPGIRPTKRDASDGLPFVVWFTTILTGLGMGGMVGKRFLF